MSERQAAAGWYPVEVGRARYWDGETWTDHFHDTGTELEVSSGAAAPARVSRIKGAASAAAGQLTSNEQHLPEGTLWSALGKTVGNVTTGRYRLDATYLYFSKGALRTDAQQVLVASVVDVDVRQSLTQRARGTYTVVARVQTNTVAPYLVSMTDVPDGPTAQRVIMQTAHEARLSLEQRAIGIEGQRHLATNTLRNEVRYDGAVPAMLAPTPAAPPTAVAPAPTPPSPETAPATAAGADPIAQLKELAALRDAGILTEEEFTATKAEILSRM